MGSAVHRSLVLCVALVALSLEPLIAGDSKNLDIAGMILVEDLPQSDAWVIARDRAHKALNERYTREYSKSRVDSSFESVNGVYEFESSIAYATDGSRTSTLMRSLKNGEPVTKEELEKSTKGMPSGSRDESSRQEKKDPFDATATGCVWVMPRTGTEFVENHLCDVYEFIVFDVPFVSAKRSTGYRGRVLIDREFSSPLLLEYSYNERVKGTSTEVSLKRIWHLDGARLLPVGINLSARMSFLFLKIDMDLEQRFSEFMEEQ